MRGLVGGANGVDAASQGPHLCVMEWLDTSALLDVRCKPRPMIRAATALLLIFFFRGARTQQRLCVFVYVWIDRVL